MRRATELINAVISELRGASLHDEFELADCLNGAAIDLADALEDISAYDLKWTTEPPAVPGWYWVKYTQEKEILEVCQYASQWRGEKPVVRISWARDRFTPLAESDITKKAKVFAGPIMGPKE